MARPLSGSERIRLKLKISQLYLSGLKQQDIASSLKCAQSTVSEYIKELSNDWVQEGIFNFDEAKRSELSKINILEIEYWNAWIKSIGIKKEVTESQRDGFAEGGRVSTTEKKTKKWSEVGDPRLLAGIQWCIEQRCKILGIEAPKKMEMDGPAFRTLTDFVQAMAINADKR